MSAEEKTYIEINNRRKPGTSTNPGLKNLVISVGKVKCLRKKKHILR